MRHLLFLTLLLALGGCNASGTFDDDDTADDDDATGDDDDTADDDDATGDDDDSSPSGQPCRDVPLLDDVEWTQVTDQLLIEGSGRLDDLTESSAAWFVPTADALAAQLDQFGPITTDDGELFDEPEDFRLLWEPEKSDLFVISAVVQASGECATSTGVYINNLVDCICFGAHVHWDQWGDSPLPAKSIRTWVFVARDQGWDEAPDAVSVWTEETTRQVNVEE